MNYEVVWDGTARGRHGKYLFAPKENTRPAVTDPPKPLIPLTPPPMRVFRRRADGNAEPLKVQIYRLLLTRDMAIADIVEHFKGKHCQSKIYSAFALLRGSGHVRVVRRELRERKNGNGPMWRQVYGPASGNRELV